MEIYILRHGTTEWNSEHRIQGNTDIALDQLGMEMARQTGLAFREKGITFDRVYASPLKRAFETARLVAGDDAEIVTDDRLWELCFGTQEGRFVEEMERNVDVPFRFFKKKPSEYDRLAKMDPSMESLTELCERTADFLTEVVETLPEKVETLPEDVETLPEKVETLPEDEETLPEKVERILIAAHGACNKGLLMHIRGEKDMDRFWGPGLQANCGVSRVTFDCETREYSVEAESEIYYDEKLLEQISSLL